MLRGSPSRRLSVVLLTALVAVLLVPFGGATRTAQHRATAGPTHATSATQASRGADTLQTASQPQMLNLDLAVIADAVGIGSPDLASTVVAPPVDRLGQDATQQTGRGPPAL